MKGLTSIEAAERLKKDGFNELISAKPKNLLHIAWEVMREPMFILLIACGSLYMVLGDYREGAILMSTIIIIIFITFYQFQKTEKALAALKNLSSPRALVIRDGKEFRIAGREVVEDDIVIINEGDRVPADGEVIQFDNLKIDESLLTGESVPVLKGIKENTAYSGTLVVQGKGIVKVTATGERTKFGEIGLSLQGVKTEKTKLHKEMRLLIRNLFIIGGILSLIVIISFMLTRGNLLGALLNGLATAMAILPEEFPVVLTVFLALGAWRLSKNKVLTRNPTAIETLGSATVLCSDKTGTITQNKMSVAAVMINRRLIIKGQFDAEKDNLFELFRTALAATSSDSIDPMEKAIVSINDSLKIAKETAMEVIQTYPFSHDLMAMTNIIKEENGGWLACSKGAPEAIFNLCKLNQEDLKMASESVEKLAGSGYRVLAIAKGNLANEQLPLNQEDLRLEYMGLVAMEDPVRDEVPKAIDECRKAGIRVIMITGDYPVTARSIGNQIGMNPEGLLITGEELEEMSDTELKEKISRVNIFARVIPDQKLRIVKALKENNEIVAMTGDGVNDAPALKAAHIGIAMGNKGTDVAREASSLVLLDDNFASIVSAIRSGRKIFDNLQKAMSYILAIHIPIIGLALIPAFFSAIPIIMMPLHIVFLELIIDPVCSIAFESEKEELGIMERPPRNPDHKFFGFNRIMFSLFEGGLLLGMVLSIYFISISEGHSDGEVRAIAFSSLIIGNICLILTNLSKTRNFIQVLRERNLAVLIILLGATGMLVLSISVPYLQHIFSFEFPGYRHFIIAVLGAIFILSILEGMKYIRLRKRKLSGLRNTTNSSFN